MKRPFFHTGIAMRLFSAAALLPMFAMAVSTSEVLGNAAIIVLIQKTQALNTAMANASKNPMNESYRQEVRQAISALPAAMMLVASEFDRGTFHDGDLAFVKGILGNVVDVDAPQKFSRFLQKPDASLIPKIGTDVPMKGTSVPALAAKSSGNRIASAPVSAGSAPAAVAPVSKERTVKSMVYDDKASKTDAYNQGFKSTAPAASTAAALPKTAKTSGIDSDSTAERAPAAVILNVEKKKTLDESFFNKILKDEKPAPKGFRSEIPRKMLWALNQVFGIPSAFAGSSGCSDCPDSKKGSGKMGAQQFMMMAMAMSAIAPVMGAMIQSNADRDIARSEQKTALATAQLQAQVAQNNTEKQMQAQADQRAAIMKMSADSAQARKESAQIQAQAMQQIADNQNKVQQAQMEMQQQAAMLAIQQAQQAQASQEKMAALTASTNLTLASLQSGQGSTNSTTGLTINRTGMTQPMIAQSALQTGVGLGNVTLNNGTSALGTPTDISGHAMRGVKTPSAGSRLLASVGSEPLVDEIDPKTGLKTGRKISVVGRGITSSKPLPGAAATVATASAPISARLAMQLSDTLSTSVSGGSTRGFKQKSAAPLAAGSSLGEFRRELTGGAVQPAPEAYWRGIRSTEIADARKIEPAPKAAAVAPAGYRAPDLDEATGKHILGF